MKSLHRLAGFRARLLKLRVLLLLLAAWGTSLPLGAHCEGAFLLNPVRVVTTVEGRREAFQRVLEGTGRELREAFRSDSVRGFAQAANIAPAVLHSQFDAADRIVGFYPTKDLQIIAFEDEAGNVYIGGIKKEGAPEIDVMEPKHVPAILDALMDRDLPPNAGYTTLRVLDLGGGRMSLWGRKAGGPDYVHFDLAVTELAGKGAGGGRPPNAQLDAFMAGDAPIVVWADPFMRARKSRGQNAMQALVALQKAYPKKRIILDDPAADLTAKIASIVQAPARVGGRANLTIVYDQTAKVDDFGLSVAYARQLRAAGVELVEYSGTETYRGEKGGGVMVLTAHSDAELRQFIDRLCGSCYFEGNLVILNSCGIANTRAALDDLLLKCHAVAAFEVQGKPTSSELGKLLSELGRRIRASGAADKKLADVYDETMAAAGLNGFWRTSPP